LQLGARLKTESQDAELVSATRKSLREYVGDHVRGFAVNERQLLVLVQVTDEMVGDVDVLGTGVVYRIFNEGNRALVILM
jgi:hypothetical protein